MAETGTQIAGTILLEGLQAIARKTHPKRLASNLLQTFEATSTQISEQSKPLDTPQEISQFLKFQSGDGEIANMISEAVSKVGNDGVIVVEPGRLLNLEVVEGMQFDRGYLAAEFITDHERQRVEIRNPQILLSEKPVGYSEIAPIVDKLIAANKPHLAIIAEDVEEEALAALIANLELNVVAVKAPGFGDRRRSMLEDISIMTGGNLMGSAYELVTAGIDDLGTAAKIIVDKETTTIVDGRGLSSELRLRITEIKKSIEDTTSDYDREKLEERLAKLVGGVAIIRAGGVTEQERQRRTASYERALRLYYDARWRGVVPGEHLALVNAATTQRGLKFSGEAQLANSILSLALETPLQRMAEGFGRSGEETLLAIRSAQKQKRNQNIGYYGDENSFVDLVKAGATVPTRNVLDLLDAAVKLAANKLASSRHTDELVRQLSS